MKSLFIVFEGLDGSGSTTQAQLLEAYFINQNQPVVISPEPTNGPIGKFLRSILSQQVNLHQEKSEFERQMSYLFAADRYYHLYNQDQGILKLLAAQIHVICTRYYFSSFAYHGHNQADWELVKRLNQDFPPPDLVIYLEVPVAIALERIQHRSQLEIYENAQKLQEVQKNYQKIFAEYSGVHLQIDATHTPEIIHQKIINFIDKNFTIY